MVSNSKLCCIRSNRALFTMLLEYGGMAIAGSIWPIFARIAYRRSKSAIHG